MKYNVEHVTRYFYTEAATLCHNQAHLVPRNAHGQKCLRHTLDINPTPSFVQRWTDIFGNTATYFTIEQSHRELSVNAKSQIEVPAQSVVPKVEISWEEASQVLQETNQSIPWDATVFLCRYSQAGTSEEARNYALESFQPGRNLFAAVMDLTERIYADFEYDPAATSISTPLSETLQRRRGVCQDFAHLQIACLRSLGLAARYVSGYLVTRPPPGKPRLVGADATHAWASVYFPNSGWIDFDPTNSRLTDSDYITLAWGRDYADVSPVRGVFLGGGTHSMSVSVDVAPTDG